MRFSQRLWEAKFMTAPIADRATRSQVPRRNRVARLSAPQKPARPRTIRAAAVHTTTAAALPIRWAVERWAWAPPQAAWPQGTPAARATSKTAIPAKPIAANTAAERAARWLRVTT